jgi:XRE family transcriptional regulator, stress-response regulator
MVLLRHLLGDVLRRLRLRQGRTLREVSAAARVSLGYLSEVERGQKEASSELLAAICTALGTPLSHVLGEVSDSFALAELQNEPVLAGVAAHGVAEHRAGQAADRSLAGAEHDLDTAVAQSFGGAGQPELRVPAGRTRGMDSEAVLRPVGLDSGHPAFDEVARRVRDVTDMVPV